MNLVQLTPQPATGRLARALQIVLLLEILILGPGLGLLWSEGRIAGGTWVALAGGWYFGFRAFAVGKNFWQTWRERTLPQLEHQIGLAATLRMLWGEYYATLIVYSFLFPFERWLVPQAPMAISRGNGMPLILIPGFACNRGYWRRFAGWLKDAGFGPVYAVTLEPVFGCIDEGARRLGERIEAVCAQTGADKVILIGHSMGGVSIRSYLHAGGSHRVAQAVTLGSPHDGTILTKGLSGLGRNLCQMSRGDAWAAALNAHQERDCPVPITAIVSPHDCIVAPQESCYLRYPNARNVVLPGIGHLEMVISRPVFEATVAALRPGSEKTPTPPEQKPLAVPAA